MSTFIFFFTANFILHYLFLFSSGGVNVREKFFPPPLNYMAQSQTFSIRNIVKKEALPRIIFSSFYIYMHVDGGELVMSRQLSCVMGECKEAQPFRTYKVCQEIRLDNAQPEGKFVRLLFEGPIVFAGFGSLFISLYTIATLFV